MFNFRFENNKEWDQDVHLFVVRDWDGEPTESEEMSPKWFSFKDIPYKNMWPDDKYWLPHVLKGERIEGDFLFGEGDKIIDYNIKIVGSWI